MKMKTCHKLVLAGLLCLMAATCGSATSELDSDASSISAASFQPAKMFNFGQFKQKFKRTYSSFVEELTRQKIYLAKTFRVFASQTRFKRGKLTYYLGINHLSDRTPKEIERTHLSVDQVKADFDVPVSMANVDSNPKSDEIILDPPSEDGFLFADWRLSGCLTEPKSQEDCGNCYSFATIALYEWRHCQDTGELLSFSEQYPLDCGWRVGMRGCQGGSALQIIDFSQKHGLALSSKYPYVGEQRQCPYEPHVSGKEMGHIRSNGMKSRKVPKSEFSQYLRKSPVVVYIATNDRFSDYGGGVDDNADCRQDWSHEMLLVGEGVQAGTHYWLLRNSFDIDWGEAGYYKLQKATQCLSFLGKGVGIVLDGRFNKEMGVLEKFSQLFKS